MEIKTISNIYSEGCHQPMEIYNLTISVKQLKCCVVSYFRTMNDKDIPPLVTTK